LIFVNSKKSLKIPKG